jgi:hypothetical protein
MPAATPTAAHEAPQTQSPQHDPLHHSAALTPTPQPHPHETHARRAKPARPAPPPTDDEILGLDTPSPRRSDPAQLAFDFDAPSADTWRDPASSASHDGHRHPERSAPVSSSVFAASANTPAHASEGPLFDAADSSAPATSERQSSAPAADPAHFRGIFEANPELRQAWHDAEQYRATFASPEAARAATAQLADLDRMDALFFSHRPEDHAELARAVATLDPQAFAGLAHAITALASGNVAQVFRPEAFRPSSAGTPLANNSAQMPSTNTWHDAAHLPSPRGDGSSVGAQHAVPGTNTWRDAAHPPTPNGPVIPRSEATRNLSSRGRSFSSDINDGREAPSSVEGQGFSPDITTRAKRDTSLPEAVAEGERPQRQSAQPTAAQAEFFHAANAAAVEGVLDAIESQVERLLPEGVSKSARNRVVGEIYRELDSTLRTNRQLGQQVRDAFQSGALDNDHRRAIVSLVTGRARQALPAVAKRVLNEWTSTIVAANNDRRARQHAAERRIDISGASGAATTGRSASPRSVDYARMSDADILNL